MQDHRVPQDDDERAIFLRVPAPEASPRLVRPDAAEHRADKAEERGEADDAIDHAVEGFGRFFIEGGSKHSARDVNKPEKSGHESTGIAGGDGDDMGGEPEISIEYGTHHLHGVGIRFAKRGISPEFALLVARNVEVLLANVIDAIVMERLACGILRLIGVKAYPDVPPAIQTLRPRVSALDFFPT